MAQELTKTTDNLLGFGGFMFLISRFNCHLFHC